MKYKPATNDPYGAMGRLLARDARRRAEANTPSKTQPYQTTAKVGQAEIAAKHAQEAADAAQAAAEKAEEEAAKALKGAEGVSPIDVSVADGTRIVTVSHTDSGVTAGNYGPDSDVSPDWGEEIDLPPQLSVDAKGHISSATARKLKMPSSTATSRSDGLMSFKDKAKIDGYPDSFSASATAESLPAGSDATATIILDGGRFDFGLGIPRGEQGPQGAKGEKGDPGLTADFKSASGTKTVGTSWTTVCSAAFSAVSGATRTIAQAAATASANQAFEMRITFDGTTAAQIASSAQGVASTYPGVGTYPGTPEQSNSAFLGAFAAPNPSGGVTVAVQAKATSSVSVTASLTSRCDFFES